MRKIKIFTGRSHPGLAKKICQNLQVPLSPMEIKEYANGCFEIVLKDNVRKKIVFLIQTSLPDSCYLHRDIWELFQMIDATSKSGAKEAIVVMPYISYARSDKIYTPGMTIAAELLVRLLETSGMRRFIGIDFHSMEFERFFSSKTRVYHLTALPLITRYLKNRNLKDTILLPGDQAAFKRTALLAEKLNLLPGSVTKKRISDAQVKIERIRGEIAKKDVIIFDDEISTGSTVRTLGEEVKRLGARSLTVAVTHGPFVKRAIGNLQELKILKEVIVTDTVPISMDAKKSLPLKVLSVAGLLAKIIREIAKAE